MKSETEILTLKEFENKWETELKHKDSNLTGTLILKEKERRAVSSLEVKGITLNWQRDAYTINLEKVTANILVEGKPPEIYANSQHLKAIYDTVGICGLSKIKGPEFYYCVEKVRRKEYLTIVPDTNILIKQILSRHFLKTLGNREGKRKVNWFQIVLPSCTLWELENNVNVDELYAKKGGRGQGYLGLQEIKILKDRYPTYIVGDKPEILLNIPQEDKKNVCV